jgi:DNA mismatch repair protein MutS
MSFIADQQTLGDLNLTGRYRPDSVFSLFSRCRSRDGETLLESMFRHPLTSSQQINERSALLQYFLQKTLRFPFTDVLLVQVKEYLDSGGLRGRAAVIAGLLRKKAMEFVLKDEGYAAVATGIRAAMKMLEKLGEVSALLEEEGPFGEQAQALKALLKRPAIAEVMGHKDEELTLAAVARCQYILKRECLEDLQRAMAIIAELDVYIAVTDVAREKGFVRARALPAAGRRLMQVTGVYHPNLAGKKAVGNDISFHPDTNILFLTGANMAGKSTLMKAFGIAVYLAHMGFPIAATDMEFCVMDGLYSSINVPDNLTMGYSHFYAEVMRVKQAAADVSSGKELVVIFDELFKGTNVQDAYDATLALTKAFAGYSSCYFIISTHIIEAGEALRPDHPGIQFAQLPTVIEEGQPRYTYRLKEGITADRHGMTIIENEKIFDILDGAAADGPSTPFPIS